jgi:hypothetical protein
MPLKSRSYEFLGLEQGARLGYHAGSEGREWLLPALTRCLPSGFTSPDDQRRKTTRESEPELYQQEDHKQILLSGFEWKART